MPSSLDQLEAEAMLLPADERAELADRLLASVEPIADVEAAWSLEIERRIQQIEAGEVELFSHEEVIAELRVKYR